MIDPSRPVPWTLLARGAGRWTGEERIAPAPWAPDGVDAVAVHDARLVLDGRGLVTDYVQTVDGEVSVRSVTFIRWREDEDRFALQHFGGPSGEPTVLSGVRDGDRLVFEGEAAWGRLRQTMDYGERGLTIRGETPGEDGAWIPVFEGAYRRDRGGEGSGTDVRPGAVGWLDLTVEDAPALRDFYASVVGWTYQGVDMGGYEDFTLEDAAGEPVAGVCHARGGNAGLPPAWLAYVVVRDLDAALDAARALGGDVVKPATAMGEARWAVIRDPVGAVLALYQPPPGSSK